MTDYEQRKMSAYADTIEIQSVKDFINLTYSLSGLALIDEFSDNKENEKRIFMDKFDGVSESKLETRDFEKLAENHAECKNKGNKAGCLNRPWHGNGAS
ncbi:hypothetical protein P4H71_00325 [Paenibacillus kribbensis]|uniref:hypothetical protein n=1 Tax=Paenibacillus kribbensis TaxID=172713 RepID=UPI002DBE0927|nr:hypothetical protein [Paenibacillus kribbensis]MEC0232798.1 hypothetical protein [Paenibacillus kribbensis]